MTAATTLDEHLQTLPISAATLTREEPGGRTDPLLPVQALPLPRLNHASEPAATTSKSKRSMLQARTASRSTTGRFRAQLPAFAPLLEELEIAGWSATPIRAGGNFHDWLLLGSDRLLVMVGHAAGPESRDPTEPALVAQAAWAAIRAHAPAHAATRARSSRSPASLSGRCPPQPCTRTSRSP